MTHINQSEQPGINPEDLLVYPGYNLGYVLGFLSGRSIVPELVTLCEKDWEQINRPHKDVHVFELIDSITSDGTQELTPKNYKDSETILIEFLMRIATTPLNSDIDVEVHCLLDGPRFARQYMKYFENLDRDNKL